MKTRNGIYYDLTKSTYCFTSRELNLIFMFSSDLYLCKFEEQFKEHRKEFNLKYSVRFKIGCEFKTLPDLILYRKIEKRGFLIYNQKGETLCLENLLLCGEKATLKD